MVTIDGGRSRTIVVEPAPRDRIIVVLAPLPFFPLSLQCPLMRPVNKQSFFKPFPSSFSKDLSFFFGCGCARSRSAWRALLFFLTLFFDFAAHGSSLGGGASDVGPFP
nr:hypothetical protein [Pandoravirus belohorizontensis]